ncbi:MAG: tripartite tricarboxylate transporter substrate binding protein [Betaproteobacteria bacterium]|nr:tripartite tricarboxylate transporter substrate binding protein [Betaproteobacteria bacterium]
MKKLLSALLFSACAVLAPAGQAQTFPTKPVTLIVPLPAGGATDVLARVLAQRLQEAWGQPVVADFRPGGGTVVGTQAVARSAPDGHTLGIILSAHSANPSLRSSLPYDTLKDLAGISRIGWSVVALVAIAGFEADDMKGLLALAKKKPGEVQYASLGVGTSTHLAGELLKTAAGIDLLHIPYNGSAPAYRDLLGGRVPLAFVIMNSAQPHVKAGKLKVLGITNARRSESYPEYPTIGESVPGYEITSWFGLVAAGGTPAPLLQRISADVVKVLGAPEMRAKLAELGVDSAPLASGEFDAFIRSEMDRLGRLVRQSGAKLD